MIFSLTGIPMRFLVVLFVLILFSTGLISEIYSAPPSKYLSKENVDTTIMKGFFVLTEAASSAGVGFRQKDAIQTAKRLSRELREKAKGDPNERYILWKIGELEAQIRLEENDLLFQARQQNQISVNIYIAKYNVEVGKSRPDFAIMKKIHVEIGELDMNKANELADSYNKRYKAISREAMFSIEKSVLSGDVKKAKEELGYCLRNKTFLGISDSKYSQMENRVNALENALIEKPLIESEINSAETAIGRFDLNSARTYISSAKYRLQAIYQNLPSEMSTILSSKIENVNKKMVRKEDSLVNVNMSLLSQKGIKAADDYLQKVLKPYGVSREKTAYVDSAILIISSPEKNKMADEIENISLSTEEEDHTFNDIREIARRKAQAKVDSMNRANEAILKSMQLEKEKNDSIIAAQNEIIHREFQRNQQIASSVTMEIYSLVEQNRISEAKNRFSSNQQNLKKFLINDAYEILEMTISQLSDEPQKSEQITYIVPDLSSKSAPKSNNTSISPQKVASSEQLKLEENEKRAQQEVIGIYALLEKNQTKNAYNRFLSIKAPLKKYLSEEAFNVLEMTVTQANDYQP